MKTSTPYTATLELDCGVLGMQKISFVCFIVNYNKTSYQVDLTFAEFESLESDSSKNIVDLIEKNIFLKGSVKELILRKYLDTREKLSEISPVEDYDPKDAA